MSTETTTIEVEVSFSSIFDQLVEDFIDPFALSIIYTVPLYIDEVGTTATDDDGNVKMVEVDVYDIREPEPWNDGLEGFLHLLQARQAARNNQTFTAWTKGDGLALRAALESGIPPQPFLGCRCLDDDPATVDSCPIHGNWCRCTFDEPGGDSIRFSADCPIHGSPPRQLNPLPPSPNGPVHGATTILTHVDPVPQQRAGESLLGLQDEEAEVQIDDQDGS